MENYVIYGEDELIIDGHRCKKLDEGLYEACDTYLVVKDVWMHDERNKGLALVTIREDDIQDRVIYVIVRRCRLDVRELQDSIDGDSVYCVV